MHTITVTDFPLFRSNYARKCLFSADIMLASEIAYSARNSAGRIYRSLVLIKCGVIHMLGFGQGA